MDELSRQNAAMQQTAMQQTVAAQATTIAAQATTVAAQATTIAARTQTNADRVAHLGPLSPSSNKLADPTSLVTPTSLQPQHWTVKIS